MPFIRKSTLEALIKAGAQMSNVCFNLKQSSSPLHPDTKVTMDECQREWDESLRNLRHPQPQQ